MATVTGFTAERMEEMEAATIVDGDVDGSGHLILTKHDASTVDAGSVIGPTGSPGVTQPELDTFMQDHLPIGSSVDYIGTVSPSTKWLLAIGQTVVNGQTLYPGFWAVIPAGMKSGSSILMPDMRGKVTVAYDAAQTEFDAITETGGAKTHTLTQAQLPAVPVTVDPPATGVTGSTGTSTVPHTHPQDGLKYIPAQNEYGVSGDTGATNVGNTNTGPATDTTHSHPSGTLSVNIAQFNSGNMGSGAPHNILQPYIVMQKLIKVL